MTSSKQRPSFYNIILQGLLAVSLLAFVSGTVWMFIAGDAFGVYIYGATAICGLINAVGLTLVLRWRKPGLLMCAAAALGECGAWFEWGPGVTAISALIGRMDWLPYAVIGFVLSVIAVPVFVLKASPSRKIIWSEMEGGLDIRHTRHIYQLTSMLVIAVAATMCLYRPAQPPVIEEETEPVMELPREITFALLDSANVTLNEVNVIEGMMDSIPAERQEAYSKRIFALKHILLSGLKADKHNTLNVCNIFKIHNGEFSAEQQKIADWYTLLPQEEQEAWLYCPSVDNLVSFEIEVKQRIATKKK